jgi:hypothetical protein
MRLRSALVVLLLSSTPLVYLPAQAKPDSAAPIQRGIKLVESGRCHEALPLLKRALPAVSDKIQRYEGGMAEVRCAMALDDTQTAVDTLLMLQRLVPDDP